MLRKAWTITAFFGIWLVILGALWAISDWVAPVHAEMLERRARMARNGNAIEALNFGASHGMAIEWLPLGLPGFHLYRPMGDLLEADFLFAEVQPELPALRCIFIGVSPGLIYLDNSAPISRDLSGTRRELYSHTASFEMIEGDYELWVGAKLSPLIRDDHWAGVYLAVKQGKRQQGSVAEDGRIPVSRTVLTSDSVSLRNGAIFTAQKHHNYEAELRKVAPDAPRRSVQALHNMIERASRNGIDVVLYTTPFHSTYIEKRPAALAEAQSIGRELAARFPNTRYFDLASSPEIQGQPGLFRDADHLNRAGGRVFSSMLADSIATRGPVGCIAGLT